jgi:alpha-glucosidase
MHSRRRLLALGTALPFVPTHAPVSEPGLAYRVASPNGRVEAVVAIDAAGRPSWRVRFDRKAVIAPSPLGLDLGPDGMLAQGLAIVRISRTRVDRQYTLVAGKTRDARDRCRQLQLDLQDANGQRRLRLTIRAYDDGVALRYRVRAALIKAELTGFHFPADYTCWGFNMGRFNTEHEGHFLPVRASSIRETDLYDIPLVCFTGSAVFAIAQADLNNYAGMGLSRGAARALGVQIRLAPRADDPTIAVRGRPGADLLSPWRVVMIADHPGRLIESTIITNLNPPSRIADANWIRSGKYAWDWWSGGIVSGVAHPGMNDATIERFIDFAAQLGLPYMLIDAGWYVTVGGHMSGPGADVLRSIPEIHLPALIEYARQRHVGLWLWTAWKALQPKIDEAYALYRRLGIKGIKIDFFNRDDQDIVNWYHRLLAKAASHRLLVDLHGAYPPDGIRRTWPNLLTREGVMGAEYNKMGSAITATHNVTLPFTRMLLGPMDYTPGGFRNVTPVDFVARNDLPLVQTTRGQALAMYVVYESPFQAIADTPDAYKYQGGTDFLAVVPTSWDETRVIGGEIGAFVVIARRSGTDWFIGAMTNEESRRLTIPLAFLRDGRVRAKIYTDGDTPAALAISERFFTPEDTIEIHLAPSGGAAIHLRGI